MSWGGPAGPRSPTRLPALRADWGLDFVVVNGENASSGAGLTPGSCEAAFRRRGGLRDAGRPCLRPEGHALLHRSRAAADPAAELRQGSARARGAAVSGDGRAQGAGGAGAGAGVHEAALRRSVLGGGGGTEERIRWAGSRRPRLSTSMPRPRARRWRWGIGATGGRALSSARIPMCRRATRRSLPGARPIRPMPGCAATMTA